MTRLKRRKELSSQHMPDVRFGTPQEVAGYRARRLAQLQPDTIIEVGAGAGFQTLEFAKVAKRVIAIDIDAERMSRGHFPGNAITIIGDALDPKVIDRVRKEAAGKTVIFLDPERPPSAEHRKLSDISPNIREFIEAYGAISGDIAIELPPFLAEIPLDCEREYLSLHGKLNRLTVYLGGLKRCETSVVRLPEEVRIERDGIAPEPAQSDVQPHYLLEPDTALQHAGLTGAALDMPVHAVDFGRKRMYFAQRRAGPLFTHYHILALGKDRVLKILPSCGTLILHGSMSEREQRDMLHDLQRHCKGKERLHLFIGNQWCIAKRSDGKPDGKPAGER